MTELACVVPGPQRRRGRGRTTRLARARLLWLAGLVALLGAGCGPKTIAVGYTPTGIAPLVHLLPVAVYQFADKRGEDEPNRIGGIYGGYGNLNNKIYGEEPVAATVTRAFVAAFTARGFPVVDETARRGFPRRTRGWP